jgi:hypothetical protein
LFERISVAKLRAKARWQFDGANRVTRRPGDPAPAPPRVRWPLTVRHVLTCELADYSAHLLEWARSVHTALASHQAPASDLGSRV